jgi:hypothetical protein
MQKKWIVFAAAVGLLGSAYGARAQESKERKPQVDVFVQQGGPEVTRQVETGVENLVEGGDGNLVFVSTEMSFGGKVVKGAPYSAQAVTETVQTLADGNRIVRKTTAQVYRDSEGRTRRDQTISAIGPYATAGEQSQTYFINDPVSGTDYVLTPSNKSAIKLPHLTFSFTTKAEAGQSQGAQVRKEGEGQSFVFTSPASPSGATAGPGVPKVQFFAYDNKTVDAKTEKLDARNIEGVQAEGTRTTETIPAGQIGNEQPIQIVNERWYSPELQVVVMTRHSDPRFGETTYKLTNIQRTEPPASLFQIPPDFHVKEMPGPGAHTNVRRVRRTEAPAPPEN